MEIEFAGYTFSFWLLTTLNRYEPEDIQITTTANGIKAHATRFSFGEGSGSTPGSWEVTFTGQPGGFSWQARAAHSELIKGIKVAIRPLPVGTVMLPIDAEFELKEGDPGRCFVYPGGYYPVRHISSTQVEPHSGPLPIWAAQFAILRTGSQDMILSAREYPPRMKKIWVYRKGASQEIQLYSEADACRRSTEYYSPEWRLETVNDWRQAVQEYAHWMAEAFQVLPFAQRSNVQPWLKEISLVVILHGLAHDGKMGHDFATMAARLEELAHLVPPGRTLVKLTGFEGRIDRNWPDSDPAPALGGEPGFQHLVSTAHRLGYRLIPHLNVWGSSFENPITLGLVKYQMHDSEGRPSTWSYDYDQDEVAEEIFAYISPDVPEWRTVQRSKIHKLVQRGMDAIYLDQTGTFINDLHHDHFRGLKALYSELGAAFPGTQFAGEAPTTEITVSLCALICGISTLPSPTQQELFRLLFGRYIRQYGYNLPPEPYRGVWGSTPTLDWWSEERYRRYVERSAVVHGIPSLNLTDRRIRLDSELVRVVIEQAQNYQMCQAEFGGGS